MAFAWPLDRLPEECSPEIAARLEVLFGERLRDEPYLPGLTPRPSQSVVFEIAERSPAITDPVRLSESEAWVAGHLLALRGYFWEAHEVWEKAWAGLPPNSAERALVRGYIQLTNACLKARMGRDKAATRLVGIARGLFDEAKAGGLSFTDPLQWPA